MDREHDVTLLPLHTLCFKRKNLRLKPFQPALFAAGRNYECSKTLAGLVWLGPRVVGVALEKGCWWCWPFPSPLPSGGRSLMEKIFQKALLLDHVNEGAPSTINQGD